MTFLSLPLLYHNLDFNNTLNIYGNIYKDFFKIPIKITSVYGSFPFAIFNGNVNLNIMQDNFLLNKNIDDIINSPKTGIPCRFDCSNILIEDKDLNNIYQNIILEYGNNSGNFIEVSDFKTLNYIKEKYENYEFIFSKNCNYLNELTPEIINTILEQDVFYLLEIDNNNEDFLSQIKRKDKIEILIGKRCQCGNNRKCNLQEQVNIMNYSNSSIFYKCNYLNNYSNNNQLIDEINYYKKLGFNHFKIDSPSLFKLSSFKEYLLHNLINEKYYLPFINGEEV